MKQLEQLLKEKWFLVAADALVVIGILSLGLDPKDQFQAFLAVAGILAASAIVVVPVIREEGTRKQRLQEEKRLRAALAQELDQLRAELRSAGEAAARRATDIEVGARKAGEAAAEAVARKASSEIAALRAELAAAAGAADGLDEIRAQIQSVADAARGATADAETALEQAESSAKDLDALRGSFGEARSKADAALRSHQAEIARLQESLDGLRRRLESAGGNPSEASAPATVVALRDEEPEAEQKVEKVAEPEPEPAKPEEPEPPPVQRTVIAAESDATGTCLIVNLMIGIGNKPFVRGTGPGLAEDAGQPMQFLAIGRWLWRAPADAPVTVQVWKNDKSPLGEPVRIPAGETRELDEDFFAG